MTLSELRKATKGMDGKLDVWFADHDHNQYDTNNLVGRVEIINKKNAKETYDIKAAKNSQAPKKYICLRH